MNRKKIILSLVAVGVLIAGLVIGLILVRQRQELRSQAAPATTLQLLGPTATIRTGDSFTVNVNINTAENLVAGVELMVKYDPAKLKAETVTRGSFLAGADFVGPTINSTAGTVYYTLLMPPGVAPKQGTGTVASIAFKALAIGNTTVSFDQANTIVIALKEGGQNVLTNAISANLTIQASAQATATPTSTPTPSPTPGGSDDDVDGSSGSETTPTPSPTVSPTASPTASPKASATPTPTTTTQTSTDDLDDSDTERTSISSTPEPIPVTGFSWPTVLGIAVGLLLVVSSVALII